MTRTTLLLLVLWIICIVNCSTNGNSALVQKTDSIIRVKRNPTVNPFDSIPTPQKTSRIKCDEGNNYRFRSKCIQECGGTVDDKDNDFKQTPDISKKSVHPYMYKLIILGSDEFFVARNGSLQTKLPDPFTFPPKNFIEKNGKAYLCFPMPEEFKNCQHWLLDEEEFLFKKEHRQLWVEVHKRHYKVWEYAHRKADNNIAVCPLEKTAAIHQRGIALLVAWLMSLICLCVLIVLSQIFPILNMKNNKILLCNLGVLFVGYLILTIKNLVSLSEGPCTFMAYFQQYAFLSAFCWINVQAIDVFLKFINLRVSQVDTVQDKKKFILYSVHGWITPLLITAITGLVEVFDAPNLNPKMSEFCWFKRKDKGLAFLYFFGPITIILFINIVLFIITVYKLCTIGKGSNMMKKGIKKELFKVYIKLFFVMGLSWTMEVISVGVGGDDQDWTVPDMINALQGVFIFIVYTCKRIFMRRLFNLICRHRKCPTWWPWKPLSMAPAEATCSTANSSGGTLSRTSQAVTMDKL